jgi:hypothetical protein
MLVDCQLQGINVSEGNFKVFTSLDHGLPDCRAFETIDFLRGKDVSLTLDLKMEV